MRLDVSLDRSPLKPHDICQLGIHVIWPEYSKLLQALRYLLYRLPFLSSDILVYDVVVFFVVFERVAEHFHE